MELQLSNPQPATPFEIFLAKVAGQKIMWLDDGYQVTGYIYKDKVYVEEMIEVEEPPKPPLP